jgi:hypothetical protein
MPKVGIAFSLGLLAFVEAIYRSSKVTHPHTLMTGCRFHLFRAMKLLPIATMVVALFLNPYLVTPVAACRYLSKVQRPETVTITPT